MSISRGPLLLLAVGSLAGLFAANVGVVDAFHVTSSSAPPGRSSNRCFFVPTSTSTHRRRGEAFVPRGIFDDVFNPTSSSSSSSASTAEEETTTTDDAEESDDAVVQEAANEAASEIEAAAGDDDDEVETEVADVVEPAAAAAVETAGVEEEGGDAAGPKRSKKRDRHTMFIGNLPFGAFAPELFVLLRNRDWKRSIDVYIYV